MSAVTIRNVPEEVHRAIRVRAAQNGRTLQAEEMCEILATAVKPEGRVKLGDLLADIGHKVKLTDEEMAVFDRVTIHPHAQRILNDFAGYKRYIGAVSNGTL